MAWLHGAAAISEELEAFRTDTRYQLALAKAKLDVVLALIAAKQKATA